MAALSAEEGGGEALHLPNPLPRIRMLSVSVQPRPVSVGVLPSAALASPTGEVLTLPTGHLALPSDKQKNKASQEEKNEI